VGGRPPALDVTKERLLQTCLHAAAGDTLLASAHDCGDGGLVVALAECAIGAGHGFAVALPDTMPPHVALFGESSARAVVSIEPADEERFLALAAEHAVPLSRLGETGGPRAMVDGMVDVPVEELADAYEGAIPRLLGETG
jgi:phosphoribosylformylglycinamidine (FGAM) synthase-like enzyme